MEAEASRSAEALERAVGFFRRRTLFVALAAAVLLVLNGAIGSLLGFDLPAALHDLPGGIVWMFSNFMPTVASFSKLGTIVSQLASTVLVSVAASCTAAVLALLLAVIGSRSVGLGGPVPLAVRAVASLLRNIPTVAWALLLLLSFRQSEFTGYLALFLGSLGYLTRCFLESIDEVSGGAVEALRATGATYGQLVAQAVMPLSATAVVSWVLFMIETNVRDATLVGILTGTGIGFVFDLYYKSFRYDNAGLVVLAVVVVVIALELTSNLVRRAIL
ncbi:MAG: ABC transporter permease subunit [Coriobacteriales bacterium]|nr:ABC transporter permease subunit [Coriobacteriales bacterium]